MRIVINRTDAIGDTLLTIPMASFLKKQYPDAKLAFLVAPRNVELLRGNPDIDEIWPFNPKDKFLQNIKVIWRHYRSFKPDVFFHVGGGVLPMLMAFLTCIPFRGGLISRPFSFFCLNKGTRQKRSLVEMHEIEYNLNLLKSFGVSWQKEDLKKLGPHIYLAHEELAEVKRDLSPLLSKEVIIVHPGMTGHTLNWPISSYVLFIRNVEEKFPNRFNFVISFTPSDEPYIAPLRKELEKNSYQDLREKIIFFNGAEKGIRYYMSFLSQATLFIGPSTGTLHMANILGVKTIGIYSPIRVQSVKRWGPAYQDELKTRIVSPEVTCAETFQCKLENCSHYECMAKIDPSFVVAKASELIGENK